MYQLQKLVSLSEKWRRKPDSFGRCWNINDDFLNGEEKNLEELIMINMINIENLDSAGRSASKSKESNLKQRSIDTTTFERSGHE